MGPPIGALDSPVEGARVHGFFPILGWALSFRGESPRIEVRIDGEPVDVKIERTSRPDVVEAYAALSETDRVGFRAIANSMPCANGKHTLSCTATSGDQTTKLGSVEFEVGNAEIDAFYRRVHSGVGGRVSRAKLDTLLEILRCPACGGNLTQESNQELRCKGCGESYALLEGAPVMVRGEAEYAIDESLLDSPVSNHQYPARILTKLEETIAGNGLALDLGAGCRSFGADRLVQVEICRYPFTDVVNQSEELPFADESFDFVFSLAVTEHVRRPWVLASEIHRVTRPGGEIIVDSAFLQPLHGYPKHYFNMTGSALRSLFSEVEVLSLEPAAYQHPWFSIRWILSSLLADLDKTSRELLSGMTIETLLEQTSAFCDTNSGDLRGVRLPSHRIEELAAGFTLHCRRK